MSSNFHDLIQGFHNFKANTLLQEAEFFDRLALGQNPKTLVIACCDSRADPAILMGCRPGDLFVVRNVAALVPSEEEAGSPDAVLAAVEYAVKHLDIHHVIVMGHSNCGGIQGLLFKEKSGRGFPFGFPLPHRNPPVTRVFGRAVRHPAVSKLIELLGRHCLSSRLYRPSLRKQSLLYA